MEEGSICHIPLYLIWGGRTGFLDPLPQKLSLYEAKLNGFACPLAQKLCLRKLLEDKNGPLKNIVDKEPGLGTAKTKILVRIIVSM